MGVDELVLNEVVRRVLAVAKPDRIILFGSAATGQMTKDSDIDILIVEPVAENRHEESVAITDAIGDVRFPVDVKIISSERFEATKNIIGGIAYPAHKYGRILYEGRRGTVSVCSVGDWIRKADLDFKTAVRLCPEDEFRDIVGFHAQQAAEKYLEGSPHPTPNRIPKDPRHQAPAHSAGASRRHNGGTPSMRRIG